MEVVPLKEKESRAFVAEEIETAHIIQKKSLIDECSLTKAFDVVSDSTGTAYVEEVCHELMEKAPTLCSTRPTLCFAKRHCDQVYGRAIIIEEFCAVDTPKVKLLRALL